MNDPIREGQPSARSEQPESLSERGSLVGHMQEGFLAHHDIEALARQPCPGDIALDDPNPVFEADQRGQFRGPANAARVQVDAGDFRPEPASPISSRSTKPGTEIRDMIIAANARTLGKSIICGKPAVVVLVVRIEVLGREILQVPPRCSNLCDDLLSGDRMTRVEVEDVSVAVGHGVGSTDSAPERPPGP